MSSPIALEQADGIAHLARALPVDLEDDVMPGLQLVEHRLPRGAVEIVEHLGMLEEVIGGDHLTKRRGVDEVVVLPVDLARARCTCGVGDGQRQRLPRRLQHRPQQAGLAGARGCRNDVQRALCRRPRRGRILAHVRFTLW